MLAALSTLALGYAQAQSPSSQPGEGASSSATEPSVVAVTAALRNAAAAPAGTGAPPAPETMPARPSLLEPGNRPGDERPGAEPAAKGQPERFDPAPERRHEREQPARTRQTGLGGERREPSPAPRLERPRGGLDDEPPSTKQRGVLDEPLPDSAPDDE